MEREWMEKLSSKGEVIRLIQDILGCGCPREVFEHIQIEMTWTNHIPMLQLILGNKLLVWIVDGMKIDRLRDRVSTLLEQGRAERDKRNLNRFRLVMVGDVPTPEANELLTLPEANHTKVHLHILPQLLGQVITR
ncbi:MAG: hypothetical protein JSW15_02455 [Deltaproteobacteria bacterium]|nr:MAG: hypothetical protein JSW15_02455 [Deltaproteobacteria bacterium]